jgi:hypothetical protein
MLIKSERTFRCPNGHVLLMDDNEQARTEHAELVKLRELNDEREARSEKLRLAHAALLRKADMQATKLKRLKAR